MLNYYHGSNNIKSVIDGIISSNLVGDFHLAPKQAVAHNYGSHVAKISLSSDIVGAHVGLINKKDNMNAAVGNEVEVVMKDGASKADLASKVIAIEVICPDGRVANIDLKSGAIASIKG